MNKYILIIATTIVLAVFVVPLYAATYQPVPVDATRGFVEVYDTNQGVEYGKARINYAYWNSGDLWYYSYQIFNNDYYNTPTVQTDDYHFGWMVIPGVAATPTTYDTINKFSINLAPGGIMSGPTDLQVLDTQAGSTAGGGSWGYSLDPNNDGLDWAVALGSDTPLPIAPARGNITKKGSSWTWSMTNSGDKSRNDDASGQYFQLASTWAPALRTAAITAGADKEASGLVMAPGIAPTVVVPEPGSLAVLASICSLAGLSLVRRKPRSR